MPLMNQPSMLGSALQLLMTLNTITIINNKVQSSPVQSSPDYLSQLARDKPGVRRLENTLCDIWGHQTRPRTGIKSRACSPGQPSQQNSPPVLQSS